MNGGMKKGPTFIAVIPVVGASGLAYPQKAPLTLALRDSPT
jgi:hypothetical protein